jgi:hypothetical protein
VFGFLSDVFPIAGQHRKPYLSIGALLYSVALISYALSGVEDVVMLALALFTATMGMIMMDVMADTMVSTDLWPNAALICQCDVLFFIVCGAVAIRARAHPRTDAVQLLLHPFRR